MHPHAGIRTTQERIGVIVEKVAEQNRHATGSAERVLVFTTGVTHVGNLSPKEGAGRRKGPDTAGIITKGKGKRTSRSTSVLKPKGVGGGLAAVTPTRTGVVRMVQGAICQQDREHANDTVAPHRTPLVPLCKPLAGDQQPLLSPFAWQTTSGLQRRKSGHAVRRHPVSGNAFPTPWISP